MCTGPPSCITEGGHVLPLPTLLQGVQAAQLGGFLTLLSSPHTAPDLVTSYHTEKAEFGLQAKFFMILAFLILMARGNFGFLGHLSISLMN